MKTLQRPLSWLLLFIFGSLTSHAAVLTFGNFNVADPDSSETTATFGQNGGALGIQLNIAAGYNYTLSSMVFDLSRGNNATTTARARVFLGSPTGSLLGTSTLTVTGAADSASLRTFSGLNVSLSGGQSGQTYWLVIDSTGGSVQIHSAAGNQLPSGAAGLSAIGFQSFNEALDTPTTTMVSSDFPNFQITVPEPHEYAMVAGIGLVAFALYRKRFPA